MPALAPPPLNTPVTDQSGQTNALWSRWYVAAQQVVTQDTAPVDAAYITAKANPSLTNEVSLGALGSGYLKIAVAAGVAAPSSTATLPASDLVGALPALDGAALTNLNATALASGTVNGARLPDPLPAISGAALTNLSASALTGSLPAISGAALTSLSSSALTGSLPAISGAALTALPNPLPATSGINLTALKGVNVTHAVVTKVFADSPYTVLSSDETILVNAVAGAVTITLPAATSGRILTVKKVDASGNAVTLSGTVDTVVNPTLTVQFQSRLIQADGSAWQIAAGYL